MLGHGPISAKSIGLPPFSFSDTGDQFKELNVLDDTINQVSLDQVVLEEAPLPV